MRNWKEDKEYLSIISELLKTEEVQKLKQFKQHHFYNRFDHSIDVSYRSYLVAKKMKLDYKSIARAGLLHDLFFYVPKEIHIGSSNHNKLHPRIALANAKKITSLNKKEEDIILKHMFLATADIPIYLESWIVTAIDKYSAIKEVTKPFTLYLKNKLYFAKVA